MKKAIQFDARELLHRQEFKATPLRIALLELLHASKDPLTAAKIMKKLKRLGVDTASVYRALGAFTENGIVRRLAGATEALYELRQYKPHMHHVHCESCGGIESIPFCVKNISKAALGKSKQFKTITDHVLSFSGTCRKCSRGVR